MDLTEDEVTQLLLQEETEDDDGNTTHMDPNNPQYRMWMRAKVKYERLLKQNDPPLQDIPPNTYVGVHPEYGIMRYAHTKKEIALKRIKNEYLFEYKNPPTPFAKSAVSTCDNTST
eukprot:TRINITY_DN5720_c0_g1_i1.p1 TRINITY_DN5720_c0_g1~~TRINITY_DN5720_c0_g1_i1.p1  ORF type:complete len:116 (+),score=18.21 TRINITY_DN5720_c0_g1_i1:15-362(+)